MTRVVTGEGAYLDLDRPFEVVACGAYLVAVSFD